MGFKIFLKDIFKGMIFVGCKVGYSIIWVHKWKTKCCHKFCSWSQEQAKVYLRRNENSEKRARPAKLLGSHV